MRPRLLLTRDALGCSDWAHALRQAGVEPVEWPCLVHEELADEGPPSLLDSLREARWLALTSPRGAQVVASKLQASKLQAPKLADLSSLESPRSWRLAAIGEATARAALEHLGPVDHVAAVSTGRGLAEELLRSYSVPELSPLVVATSDRGLGHLAEVLRGAGVEVLRHEVYATRPHPRSDSLAKLPRVDAVFLASPSALEGLLQTSHLPDDLPLITLGPTTSAAILAANLTVAAEATSPSLEGLLAAYRRFSGDRAGARKKAS